MTLQAEQVRVGITGEVFKAPRGTAAPTGPVAALDAAFVGLGYVSEDGVTESHEDSVENIVAWQNAQVVRATRTESLATIACAFLESKGSVLEAFHPGSNLVESPPGTFKLEVKPPEAEPSAWVLDVVDGDKHLRIYVGNGEVTERGEIAYVNGDAIMYPITITCYPDSDGNLMVKWSDDPAWGYS